jgi:hypothetical protein
VLMLLKRKMRKESSSLQRDITSIR